MNSILVASSVSYLPCIFCWLFAVHLKIWNELYLLTRTLFFALVFDFSFEGVFHFFFLNKGCISLDSLLLGEDPVL